VSGTQLLNNIVKTTLPGLTREQQRFRPPTASYQYNLFKDNNNNGRQRRTRDLHQRNAHQRFLTNVIIDANTFSNNRGGNNTTHLERR